MNQRMRTSPHLQKLVPEHLRGGSLAQAFYLDRDLFELEIERFLGAHWILAGHVGEIPEHGDYFVVEALGASVIVVRGANGDVHALHNVCRHRGSRICDDTAGHSALLRCRYHGWSYRLDGELAAWRHMPESLNKADFGRLRRCGVTLFEGLILISLNRVEAPDPSALLQHVQPYWARYELATCKVAATRVYAIQANWKLAIENNLECYHCLASHPEYTAANAFVRADEKIADAPEAFAAYQKSWQLKMQAANIRTGRSDMIATDGQPARAGTWPLAPGQLTASRDGKGVAPLLGRIAAHDESVTTGCIGFLSLPGRHVRLRHWGDLHSAERDHNSGRFALAGARRCRRGTRLHDRGSMLAVG